MLKIQVESKAQYSYDFDRSTLEEALWMYLRERKDIIPPTSNPDTTVKTRFMVNGNELNTGILSVNMIVEVERSSSNQFERTPLKSGTGVVIDIEA